MKQRITDDYIASLKPCSDRHSNYLTHYRGRDMSMLTFLNLKRITHEDKLWVFCRSVPKDKLGPIAADFAEQVLHLYETAYPGDLRPRAGIQGARSGINAAASAAAYAAASAAARSAASAAASAAAYAAASAADFAADSAAAYAASAVYAAAEQEKRQIDIMKKWWRSL